MIVVDNLNPIFDNNLVEISFREKVSSLLERILSRTLSYLMMWDLNLVHVKIQANFFLIFSLGRINIRHLHLLIVDGLVC
jgi:hypothetical protein